MFEAPYASILALYSMPVEGHYNVWLVETAGRGDSYSGTF
jgi:hypothetical protein